MKASEFRVGNFVAFSAAVWIVSEIVQDKIEITAVNSNETISFTQWASPDGIKLNSDWLLKFAFQEIHHGFTRYFAIKGLAINSEFESLLVNIVENNTYIFSVKSTVNTELYNSDYEGILFVHQLQNLYFALTGEELTLKDAL